MRTHRAVVILLVRAWYAAQKSENNKLQGLYRP